jgi:hypothetical protein
MTNSKAIIHVIHKHKEKVTNRFIKDLEKKHGVSFRWEHFSNKPTDFKLTVNVYDQKVKVYNDSLLLVSTGEPMSVKLDEHFERLDIKVNDISDIQELEAFLIEECEKFDIELSHDTMAAEALNFKSLSYSFFAGSIFITPQSDYAWASYMIDAITNISEEDKVSEDLDLPPWDILEDINDSAVDSLTSVGNANNYTNYFNNPSDKYKSISHKKIPDIKDLVILPGSNILKQLVDRNKLLDLAHDGAYAKLHPVTLDEDIELIKDIFGNRVFGPEYGLYELFNKAQTIHTTFTSESVVYSAFNRKELHSIAEDNTHVPSSYKGLNNHIFWINDIDKAEEFIQTFFKSEICCLFRPEDRNVKEKIRRYVDYIKSKVDYIV